MAIASTQPHRKWLFYSCVMRSKLELFYRRPYSIFFYLFSKIRTFYCRVQDVTFISYPKSGRTWIEQLLTQTVRLEYNITNSIFEQYEDICRILRGVPTIKFTHAGSSWEEFSIYNEEEILKIAPEIISKGKVVFLYRDPRDVLVSSFYHLKYRNKVENITGDAMITSKIVGLRKLLRFMSIWHRFCANHAGCLIICYEDFQKDSMKELQRLCRFIGLRADNDVIARAVEFCKFQKMKKREEQRAYRSPRLSASDVDNPNSYKVRSGTVGQYLAFFSKQQIEHINSIMSEELCSDFDFRQNYQRSIYG